jgi:ribose 5-phosphate isomerase B
MKIALGADHAGVLYKKTVIEFLKNKGFEIQDFGTNTSDSVDYPDFAHPVSQMIENKEATFGILICGSGNGVAITANKHANIRAALCWNLETAELARQHNDANILCLPARFITENQAVEMVEKFLQTSFEGGRHQKRVDKIGC